MGSVLGLIFSNFDMYDLENKIFNCIKKISNLRYVDDILILVNNINEINILQDTFPKSSVLIFELNKNNRIFFFYFLIDTNNNNNFTTSIYKNPSSNNSCILNSKGLTKNMLTKNFYYVELNMHQ